jgi:hypothetical protein
LFGDKQWGKAEASRKGKESSNRIIPSAGFLSKRLSFCVVGKVGLESSCACANIFLQENAQGGQARKTQTATGCFRPLGFKPQTYNHEKSWPKRSASSVVGKVGLEPTRFVQPTDFKSVAYTNSATRPNFLEARTGNAPVYWVLQTHA